MQKIVILASLDFKLAFKLKNAMINDITYEHINPNHLSISKYNIIFCSLGEKGNIHHPNIVELDPTYTEFQLKARVFQALNSQLNQTECFIGIDPGNAIGVCVMLNHIILETTVFYLKEKLIFWIRNKIMDLNGISTRVKIGDGGGRNQEQIITLLKNSLPNKVKIEIIDERNTSQKITSDLTSHEQAAIRIAKRKGYLI